MINLNTILKKQFENIEKFRRKRFFLYSTCSIMFLELFLFSMITKLYNVDVKEGIVVNYQLGFLFLMGILIVISFLIFKCPNCGVVPKGRAASIGGEVTISKGLNPFPKRCECCGFYLSKNTLLEDIKEIK